MSGLTGPSWAQGTATNEGQGVWPDILKTFEKGDAALLNLKKARDNPSEFFPESWRLYGTRDDWVGYFLPVGQPKEVSGRVLNLNGVARRGDILRLETMGKKPLVLVYAGERAFADAPNTQLSFFVFPYISRLEYNTFPPRLHQDLVEHWEKKYGLAKLEPLDSLAPGVQFGRYSKSDVLVAHARSPESGTWRWLQRPRLGDPPLFLPSDLWKSKPSYQFFKPVGNLAEALLLKEVRRMPCHHQMRISTCFWAAYSDVLAYETRGLRPIDQPRVVRYEKTLVSKHLEQMGEKEEKVLRDDFRAYVRPLIKSYLMETEMLSADEANQRAEQKVQQLIQEKAHWGTWLRLPENLREAQNQLKVRFKNADTYDQFVRVIEAAIRVDNPVIVNSHYVQFQHANTPAPTETQAHPLAEVQTVTDLTVDRTIGHAHVILGLQRQLGQAWIFLQDGLRAGQKPGDYEDASLTVTHVSRIQAKLYWEKCVRHAGNGQMVSKAGQPIPPLMLVGKD